MIECRQREFELLYLYNILLLCHYSLVCCVASFECQTSHYKKILFLIFFLDPAAQLAHCLSEMLSRSLYTACCLCRRGQYVCCCANLITIIMTQMAAAHQRERMGSGGDTSGLISFTPPTNLREFRFDKFPFYSHFITLQITLNRNFNEWHRMILYWLYIGNRKMYDFVNLVSNNKS